MEQARSKPTYKTLSRIIQIVKAVFTDKIEDSKKKKKEEDEEKDDEEMDEGEETKQTEAQKNKKFAQSLKHEEYQKLVQFFADELPKLALNLCNVKAFPSVDKLVQSAKYK